MKVQLMYIETRCKIQFHGSYPNTMASDTHVHGWVINFVNVAKFSYFQKNFL